MAFLGQDISLPSYIPTTAWLRHGPFAMWLVKVARPKRIVELGTHYAFSYFAFCQAVDEAGLPTHCFAVDTWLGDEHSGLYGEDVFEAVVKENAKYASFSTLLRKTFVEALDDIEDGSVDLLHVDGRHYYDDVKEDFAQWAPKLSPNAIVLFHDTEIRGRDFGVWKFWTELKDTYRTLEIPYECGLGVLFWGGDLTPDVARLREIAESKVAHEAMIEMFHAYGEILAGRYHKPVSLGESPKTSKSTSIQRRDSNETAHLHINCVYGPQHVDHIRTSLIPSLSSTTNSEIVINLLSYVPRPEKDFSELSHPNATINEITYEGPASTSIGFGKGHNILATHVRSDSFIIINPDCIALPESIDSLVHYWRSRPPDVAIIEGRQWPFEHPKEFDALSGDTPWASGAFALIDTERYRRLGGFDESYFLYLEDVDLSWRMWLDGARVVYHPKAAVMHFSGGPFYRNDITSNEVYFGFRNYVLLLFKFFGEDGKRRAIEEVKRAADPALFAACIKDINNSIQEIQPLTDALQKAAQSHPRIKALGPGRFHQMRL